MDILQMVCQLIAEIAITAIVVWKIAKHKMQARCIGDIYVDWTDPQNVEFYMALDKTPDECIRNHDIVCMRVRDVSGSKVLEGGKEE